jgi:hypothetical protein
VIAQDVDKSIIQVALKLNRAIKKDRLDVGQSIGVRPQNPENLV